MLRQQLLAAVHRNLPLCREHFRLILKVPSFPATQPGNFIQISCRDPGADYTRERLLDDQHVWARVDHGAELSSPLALLRRPFSLAGRRDLPDGVELDIIHRVVGVGTAWMAQLAAGEQVDILGPLGNQFVLPHQHQMAILVGGGVGIPPMLYLAEALRGRRGVAFSGATSKDLLPLTIIGESNATGEPGRIIQEFDDCGIPSVVTTDDGSFGFKGYVTQALEQFLNSARLCPRPEALVLYTCGPEPMMKRVAQIAADRGIECQVAVERAMACGMGTCQSCCIRVRKPDPSAVPLPGSDWCWRLTCTDGPIFRGAELMW